MPIVEGVVINLSTRTEEPQEYFANLALEFGNQALPLPGTYNREHLNKDLFDYLVSKMQSDESSRILVKGYLLRANWNYPSNMEVFEGDSSLYAVASELATELDIRNTTDAARELQCLTIARTPDKRMIYLGLARKLHKDEPDAIANVDCIHYFKEKGDNMDNLFQGGYRDDPLDSSHGAEHDVTKGL